MPSLHVAYSFLVVLVGWRVFGRAGRTTSVAFFVAMCFSAVYLEHHWVVDVLAGTAYSVGVVAAAGALARRVRSRVLSEPS
jgi:membrane-associated phospholipid phosphatase